MLTQELCDIAVKSSYRNLEHVPLIYRIKELCFIAFKQNSLAIKNIPLDYITEGMCESAIKSSDDVQLWAIPIQFLTPKLCEIAVGKCGINLEYVPEEFKCKNLYELACKSFGLALNIVPLDFHTYDMYLSAVNNTGTALSYIPESNQTVELCEIAVKNCGSALLYCADKFKTRQLCRNAVKSKNIHSNILNFIPPDFKTEEMYDDLVTSSGAHFKYLPIDQRTRARCELSFKNLDKGGRCIFLNEYPEQWVTYEMCMHFFKVKSCDTYVNFIPETHRCQELYDTLIKHNKNPHVVLDFMPEKYVTDEFLTHVLNNPYFHMCYLPDKYLNRMIKYFSKEIII